MNTFVQILLMAASGAIAADAIDKQHNFSFFSDWHYWALLTIMGLYGVLNYVEGRTKA